jgi:hypothetical protein
VGRRPAWCCGQSRESRQRAWASPSDLDEWHVEEEGGGPVTNCDGMTTEHKRVVSFTHFVGRRTGRDCSGELRRWSVGSYCAPLDSLREMVASLELHRFAWGEKFKDEGGEEWCGSAGIAGDKEAGRARDDRDRGSRRAVARCRGERTGARVGHIGPTGAVLERWRTGQSQDE